MTTIMNGTKYAKKRTSRFGEQAQNKAQIKKLLTRLSESYETCQAKMISEILENRSKKISEMRKMRPKYIWQNPMMPTNSIQNFSSQKPISSGEKYLLEKHRTNILAPQRAFNVQPNMKTGSVDVSKMINFQSNQDPKVLSKKFQEFVRITEEQSGIVKRKRMSDVTNDSLSLPAIKSPYKVTMKKTYFKKFPSDQYNFYKPPIKDITRRDRIFDLTIQRQSTQRSGSGQHEESRQFSPRAYRTLEVNISSETYRPSPNHAARTMDASRSDRVM